MSLVKPCFLDKRRLIICPLTDGSDSWALNFFFFFFSWCYKKSTFKEKERLHGSSIYIKHKNRVSTVYYSLRRIKKQAAFEGLWRDAPQPRVAFWLHLEALQSRSVSFAIPRLETNCVFVLFCQCIDTHTTTVILLIRDPLYKRGRRALAVVGLKRGGRLRSPRRPRGSLLFHQRGQPLSKSLLLPGSLSVIHHWWWMGNGEAITFSFTALYHFW